MVSINTSTSFLGEKKPKESHGETDHSGLENIFASMLEVIESKEQLVTKDSKKIPSGKGMVGLLEVIKKEISLNKIDASSQASTNGFGISSSNILQIYETYKTLIDQAIEVADEATVSFDIKRFIEPNSKQQKSTASQAKQVSDLSFINHKKNKDGFDTSTFDESSAIQELSDLEMQRIKTSMKQDQELAIEIKKNAKTKGINDESSKLSTLEEISVETRSQNNSKKNKFFSVEQNASETKPKNQMTDLTKAESVADQNQPQAKSSANKQTNIEQNTQSQSAHQAQLKLLEKSWGKDLAKIIEKAIISGKEKIDISLDPQKLGKMHLTLSVINNQTSIFISTENAAASLILTGAEDRLAQMFESSGYKLLNFHANANGGNNQNKKRAMSTQATDKNKQKDPEIKILNNEENRAYYSTDGRKIINIIA